MKDSVNFTIMRKWETSVILSLTVGYIFYNEIPSLFEIIKTIKVDFQDLTYLSKLIFIMKC